MQKQAINTNAKKKERKKHAVNAITGEKAKIYLPHCLPPPPNCNKCMKKTKKFTQPQLLSLPRVTSDCMGMESAGCFTSQLKSASLSIWGLRVQVRVARASTVPSLMGTCVWRK